MEKKGREKRISRLDLLRPVKRVVVKVGSGVLTTSHGLNKRVINDLTDDVCALKKKGVEVILVSSGAIASGLKKIGMAKRPESMVAMGRGLRRFSLQGTTFTTAGATSMPGIRYLHCCRGRSFPSSMRMIRSWWMKSSSVTMIT
jgi:hypothetical protein